MIGVEQNDAGTVMHTHRCGAGCPYYDGHPPLYLRVKPGFGLCRIQAPRPRFISYAASEVLPAWPWVDGEHDFCGSHPALVAMREEAGR